MGYCLVGFWVCVGRDPVALGIIVREPDPWHGRPLCVLLHHSLNCRVVLSLRLKGDARLSDLVDAGE